MHQSVDGNWHGLQAQEALRRLGVNPARGLSAAQAERRLSESGTNQLEERGGKSPGRVLAEQFKAVLVLVLVAAALISVFLGDYQDAVAIAAIVLLNALLGFRQEYRAERSMEALRRLAVPVVRVRRDGRVQLIPSPQLVPGDIVLLEAGNMVPADCRLIESANLRCQEASLTGESQAVSKEPDAAVAPDTPLGDRRNMAFMGTLVSRGRAEAVVTETGMRTQLGQVASMLDTTQRDRTPLQQRLDHLGRVLALAALGLVLVVLTLGWMRGEEPRILFLTAVSLAVAVIPEGLPAVVTIALALAAQRMLERHALIRKLPAVETLGSVTVICSDKTGTLTENRMAVRMIDTAEAHIDLRRQIGDDGPDSQRLQDDYSKLARQGGVLLTLAGSALCNDAILEEDGQDRRALGRGIAAAPHVVGDPTEAALVMAAAGLGHSKNSLEKAFPRQAEVPFESERKRMSTVHRLPPDSNGLPDNLAALRRCLRRAGKGDRVVFSKGAVDSLLQVCTKIWLNQGPVPLDDHWRERIEKGNNRRAQQGVRVLGLAFRILSDADSAQDLEQDLTFAGILGLLDPPRPESARSVAVCRAAGIRPKMITGDHPLTAAEIARRIGFDADAPMMTTAELESHSEEELGLKVEEASVFARVSPEHKLKVIGALQQRRHIVAMTGDGVNDAPALKKADIGVAMGKIGTDVAKQAADMVLLDDDFSTIVRAVEEGRVIYANIRRFIQYLLSCNLGEAWVMIIGPLLGMPLPLLPLQILWMNLVTDGLPALALGLEKAEPGTMSRPPHPPGESIFARGVGRDILWTGPLLGLVALTLGFLWWEEGNPRWQTLLFTTLTLSQISLSLALRSRRESVFRLGIASNPTLLLAVVLTVVLQMGVIYLPFAQGFFRTVPLTAGELGMALLVSTLVFWVVEGVKWLKRLGGSRKDAKAAALSERIEPQRTQRQDAESREEIRPGS